MSRYTAFALACACACLTPAYAHVVANPAQGAAGSYLQTAFTVSHGCKGSPTIALRIHIPEGALTAKPQMKPGWSVTIKTRKLNPPVQGPRGKTLSERVDEIEWRGGPLPDSLYDTFGLIVKLPDTPGKTLYFPVEQECQSGANHWTEIPAVNAGSHAHDHGEGAMEHPAPSVRITPAD
ncbi:MAG: YcnI family protein [Stenotrophobium sp.]